MVIIDVFIDFNKCVILSCLYVLLLQSISLRLPFGCVAAEEIATAECLIFDLATLKAAPNNFSDENKLGKGGFGVVYKVLDQLFFPLENSSKFNVCKI